jgi:hypothetical protein
MSRRRGLALVALTASLLVAGCSGGGARSADAPRPATVASESATRSAGYDSKTARIVFLHHSTGQAIWAGSGSGDGDLPRGIADYNRANNTSLTIEEVPFPSGPEYEWANYPFDYYNIWVANAGPGPYRGQPTLEMLTKQYDVIIWKHCYPVSGIQPDTGNADVGSADKRLENYKLQYAALRDKMRSFPDTRFLVWTGAALTRGSTSPEEAQRARQFVDWVRSEWDEPGDKIFLWDFYQLETEGGAYLPDSNAASPTDSHPNPTFAARVAPLLVTRIVVVVEGRGDATGLTGVTH